MIPSTLILYACLQLADPIEIALRATEAPKSVRVAFTVELRSAEAVRIFTYDPRLDEAQEWTLDLAEGEDGYLDEISATWGAEEAPDGRIFPDDLRASLGADLDIENLGQAWKLQFKHTPSANDGAFDIWAAEKLDATAWLSPDDNSFLRIDYTLPSPVRGPEGGWLFAYDQSYYLQNDPVYNLTLITAYTLKFVAGSAFGKQTQQYRMQVLSAEVFFATPEDEARFIATSAASKNDVPQDVR
jgi:hypothetical protein